MRIAVIVAGMHRSGTSATAGTLAKLGVTQPKTLLAANPSNPSGHWESQRLVDLHDHMLWTAGSRWDDWRKLDLNRLKSKLLAKYTSDIRNLIKEEYDEAQFFAIKDPRICRFIGIYDGLLPDVGITPKYLIPLRNPAEVVASLGVRDEMAPGHASLVWLRHVLDVEEATRGKKRCFISFEAVLSDWRAAMTRIQDVLGFDWPRPLIDAQEEIDAFLDNQLWHHRHASLELAEKSIVKQWVKAVYRASLRLANDPTDKKACATLDRTREAFDRVVATVGDATISRLSLRERRVGSILGDDALIDTIHASNQRVSALALERSNLRQEMHGLRGDIEAGDRKIADLARERKLLEDRITQLHNSTSWRITAPLRMVGRLVRRIGAHASV